MKKLGFTLAEVLVALGIVGVITAIVLPTFVSDSNTKAHKSTVATSVNAIENAIGSILANDTANTIAESTIADNFMGTLKDSLKCNSKADNEYLLLLKNGSKALFSITNLYAEHDGVVGTVTIDANSDKSPNKVGIDIFSYNILGNGSLVEQ